MRFLLCYRWNALCALVVFFALVTGAEARLGETEAQSATRYGQPATGLVGPTEKALMPGAEELVYNYQGWRVRAAFVNGAAVRIEYAKLPDAGGLKKLSEDEVKAILEAEKGTLTWREEKPRLGNAGLNALKTAVGGKVWERSDHATAKLVFELLLVLETREAEAVEKRLGKGAEKGGGGAVTPKF